MPFSKGGGGSGGGGSGNGRIGALLRQAGETALGLFISSDDADYDWHMRGVERQLEEAAVPSSITFDNQDQDGTVEFGAPVDWVANPERVNTAAVRYNRLSPPRSAVAATYDVGAVEIGSQQAGSEGNNDIATVLQGTAAHGKLNAHTDIEGDRGPSTATTAMRVRSPDFGEATATAQLLRSGPVFIKVDWNDEGTAGNGFRVRVQRNSGTTAGNAVAAVDNDGGGNAIGITVSVNGTVTFAAIVTAFNGVSVGGTQLVTASEQGGSSASRAFLDATLDDSADLAGGADAGGANSNTGGVTVTRAPASDPPTAATATVDAIDTSGSGGAAPTLTFSIAPAGDPAVNIVITGDDRVGAGMGLSTALVAVSWRAGTSINTTARSGSTAPRIDIRINGTVTAQTIVNLLNAYSGSADGEGFSAALASGTSGTTSVSWGSSDTHGPALRMSTGVAPSPVRLTGAGIEVTHPTPGTNGNNATVRVTKGTPALPLNGVAGVVSKNAFGTGGDLMVRSPTVGDRSGAASNTGGVRVVTGQLHTDPTGATADINVAPSGDTPVVIRITYTGVSRGTKYNGAGVHVGYDTLGGSDPDLSITAFANTGNISVTLRGTVTIASILTAFTGELAMSGGGNSGVHMTAQVVQNSGSAISVTWASTDVSVTIPSMAGAVDGAQAASASINVAPSGDTAANLLFTANTVGPGANGTRIEVISRTVAGVRFDYDAEENEVFVEIQGTYTLTALVAAINAADQTVVPAARRVTASVPSGVNGDNVSVTWASSDSEAAGTGPLAGGVDATRDPLAAVWDATANRLTVTVRDGDTIGQVRSTIAALDEFQGVGRQNSNDPGDVWFNNGAGANNQIALDATAGNHIDYNFAGGTNDGIPRSALAADWTSPLLHITGVIPSDTVQNVIDIINGLSSAPTAVVSGDTVDAANDTIYLPSGNTQSQDYNFTGGAAGGGHSVRAVYTAATNTLAITALPSDTYDSVMDAIAALSQFQRSRAGSAVDGSMPGDIWLVRQATTLDIIDTPASEGAAALEYDFAGGRNAAARSTLTVVGTVDTAPAAAAVPFVANTALTYYKTGTEGDGLTVRAQMRYNSDLAGARASATASLGGKNVRFRWYNSDAFGNGVTVRVRRVTTATNTTYNSGTKQFTLNLLDGTYTYREIQNIFARMFHPLPPIESVLGAVRMEVADADLDSEFTVTSSFATITTGAFTGGGGGSNRVVAAYVSASELVVSYETDLTAALQSSFVSQSDVIAAVNAARWEGLQLVTATTDGAAIAGPVVRWSRNPPQDGDTVPVGAGTYTFSGGTEGVSLITISGLLAVDTAQNIADAYTGPSDLFTLPSGSTAVGSFTPASRASFTGGRDELGRQTPRVVLSDDGDITIALIAEDNNSVNTTLQELTEAFWAATYVNDNGFTVPVPFASVVLDISGGGAATDPIRNQTLPTQGTGGEDFVPAGPIEALLRPDDEVQGPNIEIRYHDDHDTQQEIFDALLAQGAVDVVEIYGTDLTLVPEEPPFIRDMYPEGGDTNVTITGATAGLTFQDEGADLGRGTTVNFTGDGVSATGAGLTKTVEIRGVDNDAIEAQVSSEIQSGVKAYARTGGPVVPDAEIDPAITRDSEVKAFARAGGPVVPDAEIDPAITRDSEVASAFGNQLSTLAPDSASLNDKMPFRTAADVWGEAETGILRTLFKPTLPEWNTINGLYVFEPGDIVPHSGGVYYCLTSHQKQTSGPDTGDANWLPLRWWWGDWTARYYPKGAFTTHNGGFYGATEDIADTDPSPDNANNTKWERIDRGDAIHDGGDWSALGTWTARELVRHTQPAAAMYVTKRAVPAGIEPGVASNWATYYDRIGWVEGAPSSLVNLDIASGELIGTTRGGTEIRKALPSGGGTAVAGNPSDASASADVLTDLRIGTTDFAIPPQSADTISVHWEETSVVAASQQAGRQWALGNGATGGMWRVPFDCEVVSLGFIYALEPIQQTSTGMTLQEDHVIGFEKSDFSGALALASTDVVKDYGSVTPIPDLEVTQVAKATAGQWGFSAVFVPEADAPISLSAGDNIRPVTTSPANTSQVQPGGGTVTTGTVILTLRRTGAAALPATTVRPHVSSFRATSGDLSPAAGTLAAKVYGLEWTIAQSDHVGAARIVGFKGDWDPNNASILSTIPAGNIPHGTGSVVVPNGVELLADEKYSFRLQVFDEHVTNPTLASAPASYQDIVVTAHAPATALYHIGYVAYDANDADGAATLARITDFTNDTETSATLPARITVDLPEDSTEYQLYLFAKADQTQPSGFTSAGLPATNSFYGAQDATIATVAYKAYILRPIFRFDSDDNGQYFGVTS